MSETAPSRIWGYLFVIAFSAIIVALGAKELQHRFARRGGSADVKKLVRELKGDPEEMRASLARRNDKAATNASEEQANPHDKQELKDILEKIAP